MELTNAQWALIEPLISFYPWRADGKSVRSANPDDIQSVSYDATVKETTISFTGVTVSSNIVEDGIEIRVAVPGRQRR